MSCLPPCLRLVAVLVAALPAACCCSWLSPCLRLVHFGVCCLLLLFVFSCRLACGLLPFVIAALPAASCCPVLPPCLRLFLLALILWEFINNKSTWFADFHHHFAFNPLRQLSLIHLHFHFQFLILFLFCTLFLFPSNFQFRFLFHIHILSVSVSVFTIFTIFVSFFFVIVFSLFCY